MKKSRKDSRKFRHYAKSTRTVNVSPKITRGGICL